MRPIQHDRPTQPRSTAFANMAHGRRYAGAAGVLHDALHDEPSCMISAILPDQLVTFGLPATAYELGFQPCPTCVSAVDSEPGHPAHAASHRPATRVWARLPRYRHPAVAPRPAPGTRLAD